MLHAMPGTMCAELASDHDAGYANMGWLHNVRVAPSSRIVPGWVVKQAKFEWQCSLQACRTVCTVTRALVSELMTTGMS